MSLLDNKIVGYVFVTYTAERIQEMQQMNEHVCLVTNNRIKQRIMDSGMQIVNVLPARNKGGAADLIIEFTGAESNLQKLAESIKEIDSPNFGIYDTVISYDIIK